MPERPQTSFLPAETASQEEVKRQVALFASSGSVTQLLDGIPDLCMIMNRQRQAVYVNAAFREFLKEHGVESVYGERFGVLLGCKHPPEAEGGCGTTEACRLCGAARAVAEALKGAAASNECRIASRISGDDLDLRVKVCPIRHEGEDFLLMAMSDISAGKRRLVLERLFFHDVLNTAGGVQGLVSLMEGAPPEEAKAYVPSAVKASDRMVEQILAQKDLAAAERGELQPRISGFSAREFMEETAALFRAHDAAMGREIKVLGGEDLELAADRTLLSRVIGNLLKNALEAEHDGAVVTLSCGVANGGVFFTVHNPQQMPEDSRLLVFQRSFSTKGAGRGLGTYSIRLLTERYLGGKVSFTTGPAGTKFRVELPPRS